MPRWEGFFCSRIVNACDRSRDSCELVRGAISYRRVGGKGGDDSPEVMLARPMSLGDYTNTAALPGPYRQRLYVQVLVTWLFTGLFASPLLLACLCFLMRIWLVLIWYGQCRL